jgi:hypothetical protein
MEEVVKKIEVMEVGIAGNGERNHDADLFNNREK